MLRGRAIIPCFFGYTHNPNEGTKNNKLRDDKLQRRHLLRGGGTNCAVCALCMGKAPSEDNKCLFFSYIITNEVSCKFSGYWWMGF